MIPQAARHARVRPRRHRPRGREERAAGGDRRDGPGAGQTAQGQGGRHQVADAAHLRLRHMRPLRRRRRGRVRIQVMIDWTSHYNFELELSNL